MRKVAVTGGLSSGKSTVCEIFKELGSYVVSSDEIVHHLLSPKSPVGKQLIDLVGEEIIQGDKFDRKIIAEKVFGHKDILRSLEAILHPAVLEEIEKHYNQVCKEKKYVFFVAEIPLLYEIDKAHLFDTVIAVIADPEVARKRFEKRAKSPAEEFDQRMNHQLPPTEKSSRANYTIHNSGDIEALKTQVKKIYQQLTQEDE